MATALPDLQTEYRRLLADRTCVVTGSSRGIGKHIALEFGRHGADVAVNYRSSAGAATEVTDTITEFGTDAIAVRADVSDPTDVNHFAETVHDELGTVDVLVNNAGQTADGLFQKMTPAQWHRVIEVNLNGVFNCTRTFFEDIQSADEGRIINVSSVVGQQGNVGQANYAASKSALSGFTRTLALELAPFGSTANCIAPGFTETDMLEHVPESVREKILARVPLGRFADPEELVGIARLLASEESSYITGQVIGVNGGMR